MTTLSFRSSANRPKAAAATVTREALEAHVAAYLRRGGQIKKIAKGVSGMPLNGSWHLSRRRK
ncbi:hypothetical protein thsps21_46920 [Pseudomonas sp. No.21]|uniref:hypothetical protein n=1 Tax=Pseudomonas TaxID=286 RepID=UPI000DAA9233|nr:MULTISPECIES: hypothetical protein [Pseudomonas]MDW3713152.1 hypothetical protein [Pseudomonas sp. 2023EL-01195]PZE15402.1 hypothetical protein DMX10_00645 [Pseudomonas sp. 57B-090624]GJN46209.1 hypothetical protein TUM20249_21950 [Pseudomonas tohonis]